MQYPYGFLYWMECTLSKMSERARIGADLTAHSIMENRFSTFAVKKPNL